MRLKRLILCSYIFLCIFSSAARMENINKTITLSFIGDCTLGSTDVTRSNENSFDSYIARFGYDYPLLLTKNIFLHDDLTIANLEGCLYDFNNDRTKKTYVFRGPADFAQILTSGGIDVVNLGNNHIVDYGREGEEHTRVALEKFGIGYFGANDYSVNTYVYVNEGIKIGFLGSYISFWWKNPDQVKNCFQDLKDQSCDVIIASMHGGVEYDVLHDSLVERMANAFIRLGADIVIGHHPHTIQGIDIMEGKTIIYSLGNFCFGGNSTVRTLDTFIAQIALSFENGRYLGHQLNIIPALVSGTTPSNNYQPVIATGADAERVLKAIQKDSNFLLNTNIDNHGALQEFVYAAQ